MSALLTDLYQLTMAAGYFMAGKAKECATFEMFVRRMPPERNYLIAAGLQQAVEYLRGLRFHDDEIAYLRTLPVFEDVPEEFFAYLHDFRFHGDVWAVPEGTPIFADEPLLTVRAPLIEAQIPETFLLATVGFSTMIASKAARVVQAAEGRTVVEMGTRRAHSPEAGTLAARASYLAGCQGSSNVLAGFRYGVPVYGTSAHSWIMAFETERQAFERLHALLGPRTTYLIDTYDTHEGARRASSLGQPLWGVRLDSGDLLALSRDVRAILDQAGLPNAKIMATSDLNETRIAELVQAGAPIDAFGVGTELVTSADAPTLSVVYKMVEIETDGVTRHTAKRGEQKGTWPGGKQVYRRADHDWVTLDDEQAEGEPLLQPVLCDGELVADLPTSTEIRLHCAAARERLPAALRQLDGTAEPYPIRHSPALEALRQRLQEDLV